MLKYMIVQLCDTSPSFCHYPNEHTEPRLIPLDALEKGIHTAMCENLNMQFLYPSYELPEEYRATIESIDSTKVAPFSRDSDADIQILTDIFDAPEVQKGSTICLRLSRKQLADNIEALNCLLRKVNRLNISLTDHHGAKDDEMTEYGKVLDSLGETIVEEYKMGHLVQFNLLTDRLVLDGMNNCNAGSESITLAPDGKFYVCPAFYLEGNESVGNPFHGIELPNQHLYSIKFAPICRKCDAWQCRRCAWLNRKRTLEVNTPGHGQCITAHAEREASRRLKKRLDEAFPNNNFHNIKEVNYSDPIETLKRR